MYACVPRAHLMHPEARRGHQILYWGILIMSHNCQDAAAVSLVTTSNSTGFTLSP